MKSLVLLILMAVGDYTVCPMTLDSTPPWEKRPAIDQLESKYQLQPEIDVALVKYHGDGHAGKIYPPFTRTISYPDSYVPVLVPRSQVANLRKALGNQFLELSPGLK